MKPYCSQSSQSVISALILSIGLLFLAISVKADQWGDWTYTVSGSNVTITRYCGGGGAVVVPDAINDLSVTCVGSNAFLDCTSVMSITIPDSVTNIEFGACADCSRLTNLVIGNGVVTIGTVAFFRCTSLISVTIPASVSSIGDQAFYSCTNLIAAKVGSGVKYIGSGAFENCISLREVFFDGNAPSVGYSVFNNNYGYSSVIVYYLPGTTGWGEYFGDRLALMWNLRSGEFICCTNNQAVTITRFTGSNEYVSIPSDIESMPVTTIGNYAFCSCHSVTNVSIPFGIRSIGKRTFSDTSLSNVMIPSSVTNIGQFAFELCRNLHAIDVDEENAFYCSFSGMLFDKGQTTVIQCPSGKDGSIVVPDSVTNIGLSAFYCCFSLTNITLPAGLINIGNTAFGGCYGLKNVMIPDSVNSIGDDAFGGCSGLISVMIPDSVNSIGASAFYSCGSLTNIVIGVAVTNIGKDAFKSCSSLIAIDVNEENTRYRSNDGVLFNLDQTMLIQCPNGYSGDYVIPMGVVSIEDSAFYHCGSVTNITLPVGITNIGGSAFFYCSNLTNFVLPNSVVSIGDYAFYSCTSLNSIIIPNAVNNIGGSAFRMCTNLVDLVIGNSVTIVREQAFAYCSRLKNITMGINITNIMSAAFRSNPSLFSITIPDRVVNIGDYAFYSCANLKSVYFNGDAPNLGVSAYISSPVTNYYYPWTSGWGTTYGGRPTKINPAYTQWLIDHSFATNRTEDTTDYDNDGMLNWQEFLAHTDPTTNFDCLAVSFMDFGTNTAQISWQAKSNVTYQVMKSSDLMVAWSNAPSGIGGNQQSYQTAPVDGLLLYADPNVAEMTNAFYRVNVVP